MLEDQGMENGPMIPILANSSSKVGVGQDHRGN